MHLGILEVQGNNTGKLTMILAIKKLVRQSHLPLTLKPVVLMRFQWNSSKLWFLYKDDSEESSENNRNISYGFKYFKALINRIWNGDFPKSWNNASIAFYSADCNNLHGIFLINDGLKIMEKIIANGISKYGFDEGFIRLEQYGFHNPEECISLYTSLRIICQRRKFENKDTYLAFFFWTLKRHMILFPYIMC